MLKRMRRTLFHGLGLRNPANWVYKFRIVGGNQASMWRERRRVGGGRVKVRAGEGAGITP